LFEVFYIGFEYAYIFGAACPAKDKALGLVLPLANTDGMIEHLRLILDHYKLSLPKRLSQVPIACGVGTF
jgi:hypothetical protein